MIWEGGPAYLGLLLNKLIAACERNNLGLAKKLCALIGYYDQGGKVYRRAATIFGYEHTRADMRRRYAQSQK